MNDYYPDKDSQELFEDYNLLVEEMSELESEHEGWSEGYDY